MHLVIQLDCRSSEGSSILLGGAGLVLVHGAIFQPGESYFRMVGIGVRLPVAPPGRAGFRGLMSAKHPPTGTTLFVRRFTAEGGWPRGSRSRAIRGGGRPPSSWDRSSTGRAPDRQSGGSRFDPDRFHRGRGACLLLRPRQRGACLVCRRRRVQFSRAALSRASVTADPEARTWSNGQDGRIPPCRRRFDSCCPLSFTLRW
jgi:hypothetical protein